ncbi:MAG: UvrD-helicase domain-containing protein [Rhodospirillales bacterium]|nr:UvrD-helicase domain-containing protein [Rhodospirillales bacterium]
MEVLAADTIDPDEPQRGASDPRASVWVAASAGTGKTKVLSDRVLRLMLNGTEPRRILCLTYTKAAAAEMANRLADRLGTWAVDDDQRLEEALSKLLGRRPTEEQRRRARGLFARVLDTPGGLGIRTIHAFCQSLLGRFPLEADVAPHARPMDERDAIGLRRRALYRLLEDARQADGPLAAALSGVTRHLGEFRFNEILGEVTGQPGRFTAMIEAHGSPAAAADAARDLLGLASGETPADVIGAACADGGCDQASLRRAAGALAVGTQTERARARKMADWLEAGAETRAETFDRWAGVFLTDPKKQPQVRADKSLATTATEKAAPAPLRRCAQKQSGCCACCRDVVRQSRPKRPEPCWLSVPPCCIATGN